jgi:hypothetical protein
VIAIAIVSRTTGIEMAMAKATFIASVIAKLRERGTGIAVTEAVAKDMV